MPRLTLLFIATCHLIAAPAFAELPPPSTRVLPELSATLDRYRAESQALATQRQHRLQEIERAYYLKLNRLTLVTPDPPAPKGLFETTDEYKARLGQHRKSVEAVRAANQKTRTQMEREGELRIAVAKTDVAWLEAQLKQLTPVADAIDRLQRNGCLVPGDTATITVHRPDADTFRFPVTINHQGTLHRKAWPYPDRSRAETIWELRHKLTAVPLYGPEPAEEGGIRLGLTAFVVTGPQGTVLRRFPMEAAAPFDAVTRLARIRSKELPAARVLLALSNAVEGPLPGMRFVFISPRSFAMGSPKEAPGRRPDERRHTVTLTRPFYMQTTEVTQAQWEAIMGTNPSAFPFCGGDCPVENVYWQEVMRFITKLNATYKGKGRLRLPTEAEWEYAARTGALDPWEQSGSTPDTYAWFRANAGGAPHPVASKRPNLWNLYDMNGNVAEWCSDWYGPYPELPLARDPKGPLNGAFRVSRGGSWFHGVDGIRGAHRNRDSAGDKSGYIGFRLVLDIPPQELDGAM